MEAGILTLILSIICLFLTSSAHQIHNLSMTLASFGDDKFSFPEQHFLLYDVASLYYGSKASVSVDDIDDF